MYFTKVYYSIPPFIYCDILLLKTNHCRYSRRAKKDKGIRILQYLFRGFKDKPLDDRRDRRESVGRSNGTIHIGRNKKLKISIRIHLSLSVPLLDRYHKLRTYDNGVGGYEAILRFDSENITSGLVENFYRSSAMVFYTTLVTQSRFLLDMLLQRVDPYNPVRRMGRTDRRITRSANQDRSSR